MNECLSVAKLTSDGVTALSQHVPTEPLSSSAFLTAQPGTCSNALGLPSEAISTMMTDRIGTSSSNSARHSEGLNSSSFSSCSGGVSCRDEPLTSKWSSLPRRTSPSQSSEDVTPTMCTSTCSSSSNSSNPYEYDNVLETQVIFDIEHKDGGDDVEKAVLGTDAAATVAAARALCRTQSAGTVVHGRTMSHSHQTLAKSSTVDAFTSFRRAPSLQHRHAAANKTCVITFDGMSYTIGKSPYSDH